MTTPKQDRATRLCRTEAEIESDDVGLLDTRRAINRVAADYDGLMDNNVLI